MPTSTLIPFTQEDVSYPVCVHWEKLNPGSPASSPLFPATLLRLHFELKGDLSKLSIPTPSELPTQRDGLYQHTCFEVFIREDNRYLEWNFSPSGDWQFYHFESYRKQLTPQKNSSSLPFQNPIWQQTPRLLSLKVDIPFTELAWLGNKLKRIAFSAVLEQKNSTLSYWALRHCGDKPDFHDPKSFILHL